MSSYVSFNMHFILYRQFLIIISLTLGDARSSDIVSYQIILMQGIAKISLNFIRNYNILALFLFSLGKQFKHIGMELSHSIPIGVELLGVDFWLSCDLPIQSYSYFIPTICVQCAISFHNDQSVVQWHLATTQQSVYNFCLEMCQVLLYKSSILYFRY